MSNNLSFEIDLHEQTLARFCVDLSEQLECIGCEPPRRLSAPNLHTAILGLASSQSSECLTLSLPEDPALATFALDNPELRASRSAYVAVGCLWLTCTPIENGFSLSFTSAARAIAELMRESDSLKAVFHLLGKHSLSGSVRVVNEWGDTGTL